MSSIFSRIIAGEIPGTFVFNESHWVGLLDLFPVSAGHLLLVPREETPLLGDLSPTSLKAYGITLSHACRAMRHALGCDAISVLVRDGAAAGQEVPHVHVHLIPRYEGDECHNFKGGTYGNDEATVRSAMTAMADKLTAAWQATA